jgi:hypothetical protein
MTCGIYSIYSYNGQRGRLAAMAITGIVSSGGGEERAIVGIPERRRRMVILPFVTDLVFWPGDVVFIT